MNKIFYVPMTTPFYSNGFNAWYAVAAHFDYVSSRSTEKARAVLNLGSPHTGKFAELLDCYSREGLIKWLKKYFPHCEVV